MPAGTVTYAAITDRLDQVGYRKPPKPTRFQPGQSGNPIGRRKGLTQRHCAEGSTEVNRDGVGPILGVVAWRLDVLRLIFVDGLRAPLLRWPECGRSM